MMKTTMRDVAEAAGVSTMAVSVVLNGTGRNVTVSAAKAELIRRVARELHYQPNNLARSLRNKRTGAVCVVFQHFFRLGQEHPYHTQFLNGVIETLFENDYTLALCPKMNKDGDAGSISDGRFDGVLWCRPDFTEASLEAIQASSIPVVMMHAPPGSVLGIPTFCADNDSAMHRVAQHLQELGHRHIAFLLDPWSAKTVEGEARCQSLVTAANNLGLPVPHILVAENDCRFLSAYKPGKSKYTALVCFSDELAGFALAACKRFEIQVPRDLSVVGFDSSPFCENTKPRLTSVSQPVERMAQAATNQLLTLIREANEGLPKPPAVSSIYDCVLDVRDSTAPPPTK